jgi:hypothetical protein
MMEGGMLTTPAWKEKENFISTSDIIQKLNMKHQLADDLWTICQKCKGRYLLLHPSIKSLIKQNESSDYQ